MARKQKRVLLDNELAPKILDLFQQADIEADIIKPRAGSLAALVEHGGYSALVFQSKTNIPLDVLEAAPKSLAVIGIVGDSINNLNVIDASNNGILVKVTEYGNTYEAASLTKNLMLYMLSPEYLDSDQKTAHLFTDLKDIVPKNCSGYELADKTIGLIGCGNVAQALAAEIEPYCEKVLGYDNNPRAVYDQFHHRALLEKPAIEYCQLHTVVERSDIISIHTTGEQRVFHGNELYFATKKPFIVNTARSGTVDEAALLSALKEKRVRGAAFTVPPEYLKKDNFPEELRPFLELKNVLIAPSLGKPTADAHKKNSRKLAQSVIDYLTDKDLSLAVNPMYAYGSARSETYPIYKGSRKPLVPFRIKY